MVQDFAMASRVRKLLGTIDRETGLIIEITTTLNYLTVVIISHQPWPLADG